MTRSHWQANEYMKTAKLTQADVDRQKAAMDAHDRAVRRHKLKERFCMVAYYGCWAVTGLFFAYCLYMRQS